MAEGTANGGKGGGVSLYIYGTLDGKFHLSASDCTVTFDECVFNYVEKTKGECALNKHTLEV